MDHGRHAHRILRRASGSRTRALPPTVAADGRALLPDHHRFRLPAHTRAGAPPGRAFGRRDTCPTMNAGAIPLPSVSLRLYELVEPARRTPAPAPSLTRPSVPVSISYHTNRTETSMTTRVSQLAALPPRESRRALSTRGNSKIPITEPHRGTTGAARFTGPCPATTSQPRPYISSMSPRNGRYIADGDGPVEVNGYFLIVTQGKVVPNPLWQFDGNVDLLPGP